MPFITPLKMQLLNEDNVFPWLLLEPFTWLDPETGEEYTAPKYFRTDGASVPPAIALVPIVGPALLTRLMATGMFKAFKAGVIHDWARRAINGVRPMPAADAHKLLRKIMIEQGYPMDIVEDYYNAVVIANSNDE